MDELNESQHASFVCDGKLLTPKDTYSAIVFRIPTGEASQILVRLCMETTEGFQGNVKFCLVRNISASECESEWGFRIGTEEPGDILCRRLTGSKHTRQNSFPGFVLYPVDDAIHLLMACIEISVPGVCAAICHKLGYHLALLNLALHRTGM